MGELDPRIRIRAPLRCDGIGRLDCAEDAESGVRLAVRWLPLEANGESAALACQKLPQHPTLPRIRHTGTVGASAYVAMDFPEGELLAAREGDTVSCDTLKWIVGQIADALSTMHAQNVFHGEMSAESILLVKPEKAEKAYLWDMPLVIANRLTDRRGEERLMHQLVRTAAYLSPERARGEKPSAAGDVYALAAIACLAGGSQRPMAETTLQIVHQVALGMFVPKAPMAMPEPMKSMLERMLSPDPKKRPTAQIVADVFAPASSTPTLREMPALTWPPVSDSASVAPALPAGPRPSMPRGSPSWTAMPAVTSAPAAAIFAPPKPAMVPAAPVMKSQPAFKPSSVAIPPEAPISLVASDAAPTPPAPPRMSAPEMMMVPDPLPKAVAAKAAAPHPSPPAEPTAPVKIAVSTAPVPAPEHTAPVQPTPPKAAARPAPPVMEHSAMVEAQSFEEENDVPEASEDDVVDTTAPAVKVAKAAESVALTENVSVSPELVGDGAKALSQAEERALQLKKMVPWAIALGATMVVGALAAIAISMASRPVVVVHTPQHAVEKAAELPAAASAAEKNAGDDDDDLLTAPTRAKRAAHRWAKPADAAKPANSIAPATAAERDSDADDADAPLKRPMF